MPRFLKHPENNSGIYKINVLPRYNHYHCRLKIHAKAIIFFTPKSPSMLIHFVRMNRIVDPVIDKERIIHKARTMWELHRWLHFHDTPSRHSFAKKICI